MTVNDKKKKSEISPSQLGQRLLNSQVEHGSMRSDNDLHGH